MILLLAPLAAVPIGRAAPRGVARVLRRRPSTTPILVYRAIRLARPGGLGTVDEQDVADEPTVTLLEAMRLAADRDLVARQYATGYADVFDRALPALRAALARGRPLETAIIVAYLDFLARSPDTLIARKRGEATAREASSAGADVLESGWPDTPRSRRSPSLRRLAPRRRPRAEPRRRRPTSSPPPCSPRSEMGQSRCPLVRIGQPVAVDSTPRADLPLPHRSREAVRRARLTLQGPRHQGLPGLLLGPLHHLRRRPVRADPRPQLPGGRRGRGRPRREPLRLRLHRPPGPDPGDRRRARPPDAPADASPT